MGRMKEFNDNGLPSFSRLSIYSAAHIGEF